MWPRLGAVLALTAGALLLTMPAAQAVPSAQTEDPVDLGGAYILDQFGAVTGDEARVQSALDSLYKQTGVQLPTMRSNGPISPQKTTDSAKMTCCLRWRSKTAIMPCPSLPTRR